MTVSERYRRQAILPEVGEPGQDRLARAAVRVRGVGSAARACALYLAGAGVGRLEVDPRLAAELRRFNPEVRVVEFSAAGSFAVEIDDWRWSPSDEVLPIDAGARGALLALARHLDLP